MKILLISNFFFPRIHIASFRMESFAKYLNKAGFDVDVITEGNDDQMKVWYNCHIHYVSPPPIEKIGKFRSGESKFIHCLRAAYNLIFNNIFIDQSLFWGKKACKVAEQLMQKNNYDIVISSYGYHSPLKIAEKLREKGYCFKWILDMRDEMSKNIFFSKPMRFRLRKLERQYLKDADLILSVSSPITEGFKELEPSDKYLHVLNGFDFTPIEEPSNNTNLVISYLGSFYGQINPNNFFDALVQLKEEHKLHHSLKVRIIGNQKPLNIPELIKNNIEELPKIPHDEVRNALRQSDVLLIVHPSGRKGIYTGKLFDYLGANRYILALADPTDVISEVLKATNSGTIVDNSDIQGIKNAIVKIEDMFYNTEFPSVRMTEVMKYTREAQVNKLVSYIKRTWYDEKDNVGLRDASRSDKNGSACQGVSEVSGSVQDHCVCDRAASADA